MKKQNYLTLHAAVVEKLRAYDTANEKYANVERIAKEVGLVENWLRDDAAEELVVASLKAAK